MEDDDEFGDLYTDVLRAFPSSSHTPSQPSQSSPPKPSPLHRTIDLNLQIDDADFLPGASNSYDRVEQAPKLFVTGIGNSTWNSEDRAEGNTNLKLEPTELGDSRVLEKEDVKLRDESSKVLNFVDKSDAGGGRDKESNGNTGGVIDTRVDFGDELHNDVKFDVEEDQDGVGDIGLDEPLIPGLSSADSLLIPGVLDKRRVDVSMRLEQGGRGDDWDSDSEDDLQILLNDDTHGPMVMDGGGVVGGDDEDEDDDPLVIVADGDDPNHQGMEEQQWGEDGAQAANGERQEMVDGVKVNVGMGVVPKVGYSNHVYHPFHSQFKVRLPKLYKYRTLLTWGFEISHFVVDIFVL